MVWSQLISDNHMGTSKTGPSEFSVLEQESRALYPLINQHHWMLTNHQKGLRCGLGCLSPGKDNFQWGLTDEGHLLSRVSAVGNQRLQLWGEFIVLLQHNIHHRCQWPKLLFPFCSAILSMWFSCSWLVHDLKMAILPLVFFLYSG